ncbi:hypothetical protein [Dongia sp.]|uniref:hypothetical protein n=1 Tax=Dongia sp. TaxID=1977262 RepID=UPI0035B28669
MSGTLRNAVFIQANPQQLLGAKVAAYALKRNSAAPESFDVFIMNAPDHPFLAAREGQPYLWNSKQRIWRMADLQSFTPLRFMPPELMDFQGRAIVIDPDCFAVGDVRELFDMDMQGKAIWAAKRGSAKHNNRTWASSVMLLDCAKLGHWRTREQFDAMFAFARDYVDWINLNYEPEGSIGELPRIWNDLDRLTPETRILHNTRRRTQPWKAGLPVDFTVRQRSGGILSAKWLPWSRALTKPVSAEGHYKEHPDPKQAELFFTLLKECVAAGAVGLDEIKEAMALNYIRHDALELIEEPGRRAHRAAEAAPAAVSAAQSSAGFGEAKFTNAYLAGVMGAVAMALMAILLAPHSVQSWVIDNGPLDRLSVLCSILSVVVAAGALVTRGVRWLQVPVLAAMSIGLVGFLNAKGAVAGPLPYEISELIGALFEPDNLDGQSWSGLLLSAMLLLFLVYALTRYRASEGNVAGRSILIAALLVAIASPVAGDLVGDPSTPARALVEVLEFCSSAGFLLASIVSILGSRAAASSASLAR